MKRKTKILIVEDEALVAMRIEMELDDLGYDVCKPVATGEKAIKSAEKEKPDILLMDIRLAGKMDGIEAAQEIQSFYRVPIIFMTGYSDKEAMERADKLKPIAYLAKPVEIYEIESAIDLAKD